MVAQRSLASARSSALPLHPQAALEHVAAAALIPGPLGAVGLELEAHLVDLAQPAQRVPWQRVSDALPSLPAMPGGSRVTVEPGGQMELSTPPYDDTAAAVDALRRDETVLRTALATDRLGLACMGTDPARPAQRVNPGGRYASMEEHFTRLGTSVPGRAMMCSTAALQVNVQAGPGAGWASRLALVHLLGPVLVAASGCSPLLSGHASGWQSMRQQVWGELDQARCGPLLGGAEPTRDWAEQWARYAMHAPVMLVRDPGTGSTRAVTSRVPFAAWVAGSVRLGGRPPRLEDLDYHLTTLFPPVRLRGFLEIRYLDAVPRRWWPALAALTVALLDDPVAADQAAAACEPVAGAWTRAARDGLGDPVIARAVEGCLRAALPAVPDPLRADVEAYAELLQSGRAPGDLLAERARAEGPLAVLEEEAHA